MGLLELEGFNRDSWFTWGHFVASQCFLQNFASLLTTTTCNVDYIFVQLESVASVASQILTNMRCGLHFVQLESVAFLASQILSNRWCGLQFCPASKCCACSFWWNPQQHVIWNTGKCYIYSYSNPDWWCKLVQCTVYQALFYFMEVGTKVTMWWVVVYSGVN